MDMFWYQVKANQLGFSGQNVTNHTFYWKKKFNWKNFSLCDVRPSSSKVVDQVLKIKLADNNVAEVRE